MRTERVGIGAAVLTVTLVAAACGGEAEAGSAGWEATIDTVADTVVVRTEAGSVWGDTARLVEELRIGAMEGEDAYMLGSPESLAATDSAVYVLDRQVPVVRAYDAETGRHLGDLGREGAGPGEYRSPDAIAALPDGRVLVRDPRNIRVVVFAPDGELVDEWDHPNQGNFNTTRPFYVDTAGVAWVTTIDGFMVPPWEWEHMVIGVGPDGEVTDTIRTPEVEFERAQLEASSENGSSMRRVPFTAQDVWSFSPYRYMVTGITGDYAFTLHRRGQRALRVERSSPEPVPVLPEEAAERKASITKGLQRQYGAWRWNGPDIPDTKTPWRDLFVDADGRVWVVVSRPGEPVLSEAEAAEMEARAGHRPLRFREPPAFDVFDREGRFLGPVDAPAGLRTEDPRPLIDGDRVWAVVHDEAGVPYLVRYRLVH